MSTPLGRNPARPATEPAEKKGAAHPKPPGEGAQRPSAATKLTAVPADEAAEAAPVAKRPWIVSVGITLWQLRTALTSALVSAGVHMMLIVALAMMVGPDWNDVKVTPLVANIEAVMLKPKLEKRDPPKLMDEIKLSVPQAVKSVSPKNLAASGSGSSGSGGGSGGGFAAGFAVAGTNQGTENLVSGGTGSGIDKAYGTDMLGEVGVMGDDKATFFGIEAKGRKFVFVVDTSGSMKRNDRYLRCQQELLRSVTTMQGGQQFFIVFFSDKLYPMPENKLVYARPDQLQKTAQWLVGAVPDGGTEPWPGMQRAFRMEPDAIFLLTDGQFDPEVVKKCARIQPETKKKIPIHTIAFESQQGAVLLEAIARQSGGTFRYVP